MTKHIVFMGAGAVGSYVGGHIALSGEEVTLIDPWPDHIEAIKANGLNLSSSQGEHIIKVNALHLHEVQSLYRKPIDIAFICTKSYDTEWATVMMSQYLAPKGFVVSLQNSINEELIASVVGWGKVVGCIASTIGVDTFKAGHVVRTVEPGGAGYTVFRVGEVHGRITPRAKMLADMLGAVDSAAVTTNLWGERWSKLVQNSMVNGISASTGFASKEVFGQQVTRRLAIRLAGEAIRVGEALGYDLEPIMSQPSALWVAATEGDSAAMEELEAVMLGFTKRMTNEDGRPSTGQDITKGRRTEIDYINGLVARKGVDVGVLAPTHVAMTNLVKQVELGEVLPSLDNVVKL